MAHVTKIVLAVIFQSICKLPHRQSFELRDLNIVSQDIDECVSPQSSLAATDLGLVLYRLEITVALLACVLTARVQSFVRMGIFCIQL